MPTEDWLSRQAYAYQLPAELIAQYPLPQRDQSRMLVLDRQSGSLQHRQFTDLPELLAPGDLVVLNNTRVIPARVFGYKQAASTHLGIGKIEVFFLKRHHIEAPIKTPIETPVETSNNLPVWQALIKPSKRVSSGSTLYFYSRQSQLLKTTLSVLQPAETPYNGKWLVRLNLVEFQSVEAFLEAIGHIPIPPYLNRPDEAADTQTYQTVYAQAHPHLPGSQAAPTAGLHFTPQIFKQLEQKGIRHAEVTLTVSTGTFRSIQADDIREHRMDAETYAISTQTAQAIAQTQAAGNRIVAIGTTVTKTLETSAFYHQAHVVAETRSSELFIYPGFRFQVVNALLTNFHLPESTLLMLVSAFASPQSIRQAYEHAIAERYRFYSYGDCMLIV